MRGKLRFRGFIEIKFLLSEGVCEPGGGIDHRQHGGRDLGLHHPGTSVLNFSGEHRNQVGAPGFSLWSMLLRTFSRAIGLTKTFLKL